MKDRILIVEDEAEYRNLFVRYLTAEGYTVTAVADGQAMRTKLETQEFDLIILDLGLPGEDGLSLLKALRTKASPTPVIIVSGKADPVDRVVGLEVGADDYVTKPFLNRELLARVKAVMRRAKHPAGETPAESAGGDRLGFLNWELDVMGRRLAGANGEQVKLTSAEFDLLVALARNPGRPLSRDTLLDLVHRRDWSPIDRSIDVHIVNLRKKIEPDPRNPSVITTVRNIGYSFSVPVRKL
jgi:two-component system phosphate regulon response regulator OmpR